MERQTTVTEVAIQIVVGFAIGYGLGCLVNAIRKRVR